MRKLFAIVAISLLAFPGAIFAQWGNPGHGGNHGGNTGGIHQPPTHPGHGGGYDNPGHPGNGGGYNPGHPGNGGGFDNPGHPGLPGNGGGYNPGQPGHGGGFNPGPSMELRQTFMRIKRTFNNVMTSFHPFMNQHEVRECAMGLGRLVREFDLAIIQAPRFADRELRGIQRQLDSARFTLVTENSPREAARKVRWAENEFDRLSAQILHR